MAPILYKSRRHAYAPTSNTSSQDNQEKITSWVPFAFLFMHGASFAAFRAPELRNPIITL